MLTKKDFYVGQELILVFESKEIEERILTVSSVEMRYVRFGGFKIDLLDEYFLNERFFQLKNYGAMGRFFFSEKEKDDYEELQILKRTIEHEARLIKDLELTRKIFNLMRSI